MFLSNGAISLNFWISIRIDNACRSKKFFMNQGKASYSMVSFDKTLRYIKSFIGKNWHILSIHVKLKKYFDRKTGHYL